MKKVSYMLIRVEHECSKARALSIMRDKIGHSILLDLVRLRTENSKCIEVKGIVGTKYGLPGVGNPGPEVTKVIRENERW